MRRISRGLLAVSTLAGVMVGGPAATADSGGPGSVIAVRPLAAKLWLPGTGRATRLSYRTIGVADRPALSTGATFVPKGTPPRGGWPVLAWAHPTAGLGDRCAPSVSGRYEIENTYLSGWLKHGYAVVATDYVGLGTPGVHPYLDGRTAAHSVVDMVRAARAKDPSLSRRWVVAGQSQGAHASMFTGHLATRYAPELRFLGTVGSGVPSQLEKLFPLLGPYVPNVGGDVTAVASYALAGLRAARPDFAMNRYLSPLGKRVVKDAETLCYAAQNKRTKGISVGQLLNRPLLDASFYNMIRSVAEVPTRGYDRPIFIAQGLKDVSVLPPLTAVLVTQLKLGGANLTVRTYPVDHFGTMNAGLTDSIAFADHLSAAH